MWNKAQYETKLKLIEKESPEFINKWKNSSHVIGLTARPYDLKDLTSQNLKVNNIIFSSFVNHNIDVFHDGILFCSNNLKSALLSSFINKVLFEEKPKKILIIDDKKEHLDDILKSSLIRNFEINCFHYLNKPIY